MTLEQLVVLTRERLAARARRVVPEGPLVRAAVLVPLLDRGEPYLVFAKRTDRVGTHKGQISFPGGTLDPADPSLLDAALRECEEEVGLPRAVPLAKALEMILMAKTLTAQEALQLGLVNAVVALPELLPTARQWAETICERGPLAVRAAKEAVIRGLSLPLADGLRLEAFLSGTLRGTEDAVEGPKAFAEKRKPSFKAR